MNKFFYFFLLLTTITFSGCQYDNYIPKPRGYQRINFPAKKYIPFELAGFPYNFEYPVYAQTVKDTVFFDKKPENPYWMNLDFVQLNAKVYLTYKPITSRQDLAIKIEDAYKMTNAHNKKADFIDDPTFHTANNVHGVFFEVGGNAASALQFFATDSQKHFLRGALYFNATPNADSLGPATEYLRADVQHLIKTLKWTK